MSVVVPAGSKCRRVASRTLTIQPSMVKSFSSQKNVWALTVSQRAGLIRPDGSRLRQAFVHFRSTMQSHPNMYLVFRERPTVDPTVMPPAENGTVVMGARIRDLKQEQKRVLFSGRNIYAEIWVNRDAPTAMEHTSTVTFDLSLKPKMKDAVLKTMHRRPTSTEQRLASGASNVQDIASDEE